MTVDNVLELLCGLGSTADEVASTLHGFTGLPADPLRCPVSRYLRAAGVQSPSVGIEKVAFTPTRGEPMAYLPNPVAAFVVAFDAGKYPALVGP